MLSMSLPGKIIPIASMKLRGELSFDEKDAEIRGTAIYISVGGPPSKSKAGQLQMLHQNRA